jgi:hypothetical protein
MNLLSVEGPHISFYVVDVNTCSKIAFTHKFAW